MTDIIFAFDKSTFDTADEKLLLALRPYIRCVKVGLEALTAIDERGVTIARRVLEYCASIGIDVFLDIKLKDIGNTVGRAIRNIGAQGYRYFTYHLDMSDNALRVVEEESRAAGILALGVTVLTDIQDHQSRRLHGAKTAIAVKRRIKNALSHGLHNFVCSAHEAPLIRSMAGASALIITPGVRPSWAVADDQARTSTPLFAAQAGVDFLVVGRPISQPPAHIGTPIDAVKMIRHEIDRA